MIPLKELDYNLNKKEFRDAIKLRYDWEITGTPMLWACGVQFSVDHAMVCQRGGFIIQCHNVCHPNADSYRDLIPKQIYKKHDNEKKRRYAERVMEIEQGTFTPLVFTTTRWNGG